MAASPNSGVQLNLMDSQHNQNQNNEPVNKSIRSLAKSKRLMKFIIIILSVLVLLLFILTLIFGIQFYQTKLSIQTCNQSVNKPPNKNEYSKMTYKLNSIWKDYKLPDFIIPTHYIVLFQVLTHKINRTIDPLHTNLSEPFYGNVSLKFYLTKPNKFFILHYKNLNILSYKLYLSEIDITSKIKETKYDKLLNYWIFVLKDELEVNKNYTINVVYRGFIVYENGAILKSIYNDVIQKKKKIVIYSKLEPVGARSMMPCFDEPIKKIFFQFNIIHETSKTALTNMPENSSEIISNSSLINSDNYDPAKYGKLKLTRFEVTPLVMSCYLMAFNILEDYKYISKYRKPNHLVRIWYPNVMKGVAEKPLAFAVECENQMERFFELLSPLSKSDHVYIPNFASGAMENWGLITYRDNQLLVKSDSTILRAERRLQTIAHELAHYWFGNYVTLDWWSDLWVNEGFASFYASEFFLRLMNLTNQSGFLFNAYKSRRILYSDVNMPAPIIKDVKYPLKFRSTFDKFTYVKGKCLIRWLSSIMGDKKYNKAINNYLQVYKTNNSNAEQFFDIIEQQGIIQTSNGPIPSLKNMFMFWLNTSRFPILMVKYLEAEKMISIVQQPVNSIESNSTKWPVHTTYITKTNNRDTPIYFDDKIEFPLHFSDPSDFIVINSNTKSYVHVDYSEVLFERLIDAYGTGKLGDIQRYVVMENYLFLTQYIMVNMTKSKRIFDKLSIETNPIIWMKFYKVIYLKILFSCHNELKFNNFRNYMLNLSKKAWDTFVNDNYTDPLYRENSKYILRLNAEMDNKAAIDWISKKFNKWLNKPYDTKLPNHLRTIILYYGLKFNDNYDNWMKIWKMLRTKNETLDVKSISLKIALLATSRSYLLNKVFDLFAEKYTHISQTDKLQDFSNMIPYLTLSFNGFSTFKNWLLKNSDKIKSYFIDYSYNPKKKLKNMQSLICAYTNDIRWVRPFNEYIDEVTCKRIYRKQNFWKRKIALELLDLL